MRSKNAGALLVTLDLIFEDEARYQKVRDSGVITPALIAERYGVSQNEVSDHPLRRCLRDQNHAAAALSRPVTFGDSDIYGAQQHAPLLDIEIPD